MFEKSDVRMRVGFFEHGLGGFSGFTQKFFIIIRVNPLDPLNPCSNFRLLREPLDLFRPSRFFMISLLGR